MSGSAAYELDRRLSAIKQVRKLHIDSLSGAARKRWEAELVQHRKALSNISSHLSQLGRRGAAEMDALREDQRIIEDELEALRTR